LNVPAAYFENQVQMKTVQQQRTQLEPVIRAMGPLSLVRSSEEHAGPHRAWFWDPTQQGGGVMSDMGCHCLAVGWYVLTPPGKPVDFLRPQSVSADLSLLKWGQPPWRKQLLDRFGVDYSKTPAEDFATGMVTYRNPETGQVVKSQFTVSWMFDKQGLRLLLDGMGPGYAFEMNSLRSPLEIFIGDAAVAGLALPWVFGLSFSALPSGQAKKENPNPLGPIHALEFGAPDFRAGRWLVEIMSTECEHCRDAVFALNLIHEDPALPSVVALSINPAARVSAFKKETQASYPVIRVARADYLRLLGSGTIPRLILVEDDEIKAVWDQEMPDFEALRAPASAPPGP